MHFKLKWDPSGTWLHSVEVKSNNYRPSKVKKTCKHTSLLLKQKQDRPWRTASIFKIPLLFWLAGKTGLQIGLGELRLPQAPFAGANVTAGRVGWRGVELSSRGGWLSFALIWTQAGGVGLVRDAAGRQWRGWARVEKEKPAQHHHNGSLASLCCITDTLYPPLLTVDFTYQHRTRLFWSTDRALNARRTLKNSYIKRSSFLSTCVALSQKTYLAYHGTATHSSQWHWSTALSPVYCSSTQLCSAAGSVCPVVQSAGPAA